MRAQAGSDVVDRKVPIRHPPGPTDRVEHKAAFIDRLQSGAGQQIVKFVGRDELRPVVGAFGQPAHHPLRPQDRHRETLGVAVDGRADHQAAWFQQIVAGGQVSQRVGNVFDHLHVQHSVELFARPGHRLGGGVTIVYGQVGLFCVDPGDRDVALGGIGADNVCPQPRHGFAQQSATAPNVEDSQASEWAVSRQVAVKLSGDLACDVIQPHRVHHVQGLEFSLNVPPLGGHSLKFGDFGVIDRALHLRLRKKYLCNPRACRDRWVI